jgi:tRNA G10  N-methylase Trm11
VGNNADLFPDVLRLYVLAGSKILDMTYGTGAFWKKVNKDNYTLIKNDIDPLRGDYHENFRNTSWPDNSFDTVILDPPYLYVGGFATLKDSIDRNYNNRERAKDIRGVIAVDKMYEDAIKEASRLLKHKGILILKCMDQVMSGKQVWAHIVYLHMAETLGFRSEDLFVMVQKNRPTLRHKYQKHARRNHSYFLVLRRWRGK